MSSTPDGGPAFPGPHHQDEGLTLRDYFAAAALPSIHDLRESLYLAHSADGIAEVAYKLADAMLKARAK